MLASFAGSLFSLLIFTDQRSFLFSLLIRCASTAAITVIAFRYHSLTELLKNASAVFITSLLFSGVMIFCYRVFHPPNLLIINDTVYFEFNPVIMIAITAAVYAVLYLFEKLFRQRLRPSAVLLRFQVGQKSYSCAGMIDTGCTLTEPFSDAPVIIVDNSVLTLSDDCDRRIIPYTALNHSSVLFGVKADSVTVGDKTVSKTVYIAVSDLHNRAFQAIINSDVIR